MEKSKDPQFEKYVHISYSFNNNFESIKGFVNHLNPIASKKDSQSIDKVIKAVNSAYEKAGIDLSDKSKKNRELSDAQKRIVAENLKLPDLKFSNQVELLLKSNFVMLVSHFEYLFSDIIKYYYKFYPDSALDKVIEISLDDLKKCDKIEELIDEIISKHVEKLLYQNIDNQLDYFKKHLKFSLEEDLIDWGAIKEAIHRRHLIIHNNGLINKRYLSEFEAKIPDDLKEAKEGSNVSITASYFNKVYLEMYLAGQILLQNGLRKWLKRYEEYANSQLIDITFQTNIDHDYIIAERLGLYAKKHNKITKDSYLRIFINYCLALKGQGKNKELKEALDSFDHTSLSPIFVVAYYSLLGNSTKVLANLRNAKIVDKLDYIHIKEWPLFEDLRKKRGFLIKSKTILDSVNVN